MASEDEEKTIPLHILIDTQYNKVVLVETTKDFVDTLFSFLSLPLGTIVRLLNTNNFDSSFLGSISNIYQSIQNLAANDLCNLVCKKMLLYLRNPCEALCTKLFLNIDDTEEIIAPKFFVCDSCNKFTIFHNLVCTCGKSPNRHPLDLDSSQGQHNNTTRVEEANAGVFVRGNEYGSMFLVSDDLTIVPRTSMMTSINFLRKLGYNDVTKLKRRSLNIGKHGILKLLIFTLTSHEPLTNTILECWSLKKHNPPNMPAGVIRAKSSTNDFKIDVKLVKSKSHEKIIFVEADGDFVDFMFSFLAIPLGSMVKLFNGNSFFGCLDNLYKSVETLDSSWCTESCSLLLNPGVAPQFGCLKQPLNIHDVELPTYYYGTGRLETYKDHYGCQRTREVTIKEGVISKSHGLVLKARTLSALDPRSPNSSKEGVVGFVTRSSLYVVGDDLTVKPLSHNSSLLYLKELRLPLKCLEEKDSIGGAEALSLLRASLTSKFTLNSALEYFCKLPKQESSLTSKYRNACQLKVE